MWASDLYVVISDPDENGGWGARIYHNPLVPWLWAGSVIMVIGGLVSLTDRRLRIGAPERARRRAAPAAAQGQEA